MVHVALINQKVHLEHTHLSTSLAATHVQALLAVPGIAELLDGLAVYTQNHFSRLGRLQRSAYLLDYTLASMNALLPPSSGHPVTAAAGDAPGATSSVSGRNGYVMSAPVGAAQDDGSPAAAVLDALPSPATPLQHERGAEAAGGDVHAAIAAEGDAAEASSRQNGSKGVAEDAAPHPDGTAGTPAAQQADIQQTGTGKRKRSLAKNKRRSVAGTPEAHAASATVRKGKKAKQTKT
jgi:Utp13 specific WD40 associated domain